MTFDRRNLLLSLSSGLVAYGCSSPLLRRLADSGSDEFLRAVRAGELEAVQRWLERDPALAAARDANGLSAYLIAHLAGHEGIALCLRKAGLELDLVECVFAEDWERFDVLAAADPQALNALHPIGGTALYAAALHGSLGFWRLRSCGGLSDVAPPEGTGFTPVRGAMEHRTVSGAEISICDLLGNGGAPNAPQRGGDSLLHGAVRRRSERLVRCAVRKGADVTARDAQGRTARDLAAELDWQQGGVLLDGHLDLPRDHRASRFAFDAGFTPIERPDLSDVPRELKNRVTGSSHGRLDLVREFVEKDERLVFSISTDDELAIEASAHMGHRPLMRFHLDHGAPLSLPTAVSLGDVGAVDRLLDWDPLLVHERGAHDYPVLFYAALGGGGVELAQRLVARGASVDQESAGTTTLHWCVRRSEIELAEWLIGQGCDVNALGYRWHRAGQTPLDVARLEENRALVELLEKAGAKG